MTQGTNNPNELMELPNSFLHTNFRISSNGETLILSDEYENVLDSVFTNTLETDMSLGRTLEGVNWNIFSIPSPWESNDNPAFTGALNDLEFSLESGFFNVTPIVLAINSPDDSATIYYTTGWD